MLKKILLFLLICPCGIYAQNTIGLPHVSNFPKTLYNAGLQNWDIAQDRNGLMYFANNEGLLTFDGTFWNNNPLPNKTIVSSVAVGASRKIFVGGQDELGFFAPGSNGKLVYNSLIDLIKPAYRSFGDVWDIKVANDFVYFRTSNTIFRYNGRNFVAFAAPREWLFLSTIKNVVYAQDREKGLLVYNGSWLPVVSHPSLPPDDPITGILPLTGDSLLVTTLKSGLFYVYRNELKPLNTLNNRLFMRDRVYTCAKIGDKRIALATNNNGVYIIDPLGNIVQTFTTREQLQTNHVLSIFVDAQVNIWLGLNNGIDLISYNTAIKKVTPLFKDGLGYTTLIHKGKLYAGTSNGLFSVALQKQDDLSFSKGNFVQVEGTTGHAWNLSEIYGNLLLGHHEGAFQITERGARPVTKSTGFWTYSSLDTAKQLVVAGNYRGVALLSHTGSNFVPLGNVPGFAESSRFVTIDNDKAIWVSHPYHGVFKITSSAGKYKVKTYSQKDGLPSTLNNHVYKLQAEVVVCTEKGIYIYNEVKDNFEASPYYQRLLGNRSIRYATKDGNGNLWFISEKNLGVVDFSGNKPSIIYLPELTNKMLSGFESIYPYNANNVFIGGENGFYLINYSKYKKLSARLLVHIRSVKLVDDGDSVLYGGYNNNLQINRDQVKKQVPRLNYTFKTLHFEFSSPVYGYSSNLKYAYRLVGHNDNWSEWTARTEKEYTNLSPGRYTFQVKVSNNLGAESPVAQYSFKVLPPWYRTFWSIMIYIICLMAIVYYLYNWQQNKFRQQQIKYEEEQKRLVYIYELERQKADAELVSLRNQKLESDISFKNAELASSAMHLVKKSELLTRLKTDIIQIVKAVGNGQTSDDLKRLIKSLSEDEHIDDEWENFTQHFDSVHTGFLANLKAKHPTLSGRETKLCTYLRMNLSTKEIAQLLNISIRGVEISRYRLRKKLGISTEVNLFEYLAQLDMSP